MKIAIIGSREMTRKPVVDVLETLDDLKRNDIVVITGGARGTDEIVEDYCKIKMINVKVIRPIDERSPINYLFRNVEILTEADKVVAFWDGQSRGTKFVIDYCKARNKPVQIFRSDAQ